MESLPEAAHPAWDAYLAMEQSKQAHFNFLGELEAKYEQGGYRTGAETLRLENLLSDHDDRVQTFRRLIKRLQTSDLVAYQALLQHIPSSMPIWGQMPNQRNSRRATSSLSSNGGQMSDESLIAVFVDFENLARGALDNKGSFEIQRVLKRLLEKGRIVYKRATATGPNLRSAVLSSTPMG